jgi:hypothetical protein
VIAFEVIKERQKQIQPAVKKLERFVNITLFVFGRKKVIAFRSFYVQTRTETA